MYKTAARFGSSSGRIYLKTVKSSNSTGSCNSGAYKKTKNKSLIDLSKIVAGSTIEGRITKIEDYGAFVDLGGVNGLLHISEISDKWVSHPNEVFAINQKIKTRIIRIEKDKVGRYKIALSMKPVRTELKETKESKISHCKKEEEIIISVNNASNNAKIASFKQCPYCNALIKPKRYEIHLSNKCPNRPR